MLLFLFLFLSSFQVGFLGLGGNAGAQALLEHEYITLHHWLTPAQLSDLMVFCRTLPGGTGLNASTMSASLAVATRFGFWGTVAASILSVGGLALPPMLWTAILDKAKEWNKHRKLIDCVMVVLRPLVPGLIAGAALLMMRQDIFFSYTMHPWHFCICIFLFLATLVGTIVYRFNGTFMVLLCGIAGWILL